jgi:hypothetical protein
VYDEYEFTYDRDNWQHRTAYEFEQSIRVIERETELAIYDRQKEKRELTVLQEEPQQETSGNSDTYEYLSELLLLSSGLKASRIQRSCRK